MMRTYFRTHFKTLLFCKFDHLDGIRCRTMTQMKLCSGFLTEHNISCDNNILHRIRNARHVKFLCLRIRIHNATVDHIDIFTMCQNRNTVLCCLKHSFTIHLGIHNRLSVFTDRRNSGFNHTLDIRKFLSLLSLRYGSDLHYMNTVTAGSLCMNIIYNISIIYHRLRIRHGKYRCIPTVCSRSHTCIDIFLLFKSRITEMHMHINKARHHVISLCLNHTIRLFSLQILTNLSDHIILNPYISNFIHLRCRIYHMTAFNQNIHIYSILSSC